MLKDTKYWVAWNLVPGIGRVRLGLLKEHFGSLEAAWAAPSSELRAAGLEAKAIAAFAAMRPKTSPDAEMERLHKSGVEPLSLEDPTYPERLREIYDPPAVLYVQGTIVPEDAWSITVVGTRTPSAYGREVAARLVKDLALNRVTVVSGLARGIDAVAHQTVLDCGARTIAVQACGLDIVYPPAHTNMARRIAETGAVMSDYPLGTKPRAEYFPRRNRILAGLSLGTLVIEAGEKSGALITAKFANDEGREVMAVPGSILSPQARGCNRLIQDGAKAVLDVQDILEEVNVRAPASRQVVQRQPTQSQMPLPGLAQATGANPNGSPSAVNSTPVSAPPLSQEEALLLQHLSSEPAHVDAIRRSAGLSIAAVSSTLAVLELKGLAKQVGAMNYILA